MATDAPTPIPERLRPIMWTAYRAFDVNFFKKFEKTNPWPANRLAQENWEERGRALRLQDAFTRLRANRMLRPWTDDELGLALEMIDLIWNVGYQLYNDGYSSAEDLEARFPGVPFRLCDAYMGYLGSILK